MTIALPNARLHMERLARPERARTIAFTLILCAIIGIEAMALVAWLPATFDVWLHPAAHGYGDFDNFYESARTLSPSNAYNPALGAALHPLTYLGLDTAFRVYVALNAAAVCGIAFIAQRGVASYPAKAAVVLGVLALPQAHWALRVGHFSEILAVAALGGFVLADRRPVLAGVCFSVLALKLQYLPVPLLFLLWTRNWRAFASATGTLLTLSIAGAIALTASTGYVAGYYGDRLAAVARDLLFGQNELLLPVQQSWQYSWRGFLISAGIDPNGAIVATLLVLSAAAMLLVWVRCSRSVAAVGAAIGMLLLAPYSSFYNWGMIAVAAALLLRSDLRPRPLVPALMAMLALAAVASQEATPFPSNDALGAASTRGLYWLQPVALLTLFVLAIAGKQRDAIAGVDTLDEQPAAAPIALERRRFAPAAALTLAALTCIALGYAGGAYISSNAPFATESNFSRGRVLAALPADLPLPRDARSVRTSAGDNLPYRAEWAHGAAPATVAASMQRQLDAGAWRVTSVRSDGDTTLITAARVDATGAADAMAEVTVSAATSLDGTHVVLEFAPLPVTDVRGYAEWLADRGYIVKNVAPEDYDALR